MTKYVITNADDFGLSPGVNRGIVEACRAGTLSSTSMMVNMPGFKDALNLANTCPELGIGLHFNLTYGSPVAPAARIPSLVQPNGAFRSIDDFNPQSERDIATELEAQWDRLLRAGIVPSHLDSHHLLHQRFPAVYNVMSAFAANRGVPLRRTQAAHEREDSPHLKTDHILLDTYDKAAGLNKLIGYLHNVPDGVTEITCHPGYSDPMLASLSTWTASRDEEQEVFTHPSVAQAITDNGVRLISYRSLREALQENSLATTPLQHEPEPLPDAVPLSAPLAPPDRQPVRKKRKLSLRRRRRRTAGGRKWVSNRRAGKADVPARKGKRAPKQRSIAASGARQRKAAAQNPTNKRGRALKHT